MTKRSLMACATRTCPNWVAGAERNCKAFWFGFEQGVLYKDCGFTDLYAKAGVYSRDVILPPEK